MNTSENKLPFETMTQQTTQLPPDNFIEQVKQALEHLYDLPYLQQHPLTWLLKASLPKQAAGQHLRRAIIEAIEQLNPGADVFFRAPQARPYQLLQLCYVEGFSIQEGAAELSVSERQAYRDIRKGQTQIAHILWQQLEQSPTATTADLEEVSSFTSEVAHISRHSEEINLTDLICSVLSSVKPLINSHDVTIHNQLPDEAIMITTQPDISRQVLINIVSHIVKQARGEIDLKVGQQTNGIDISWQYQQRDTTRSIGLDRIITTQFLKQINWEFTQEHVADDMIRSTIYIAVNKPTILMIDDNKDLVQLIDRYLTQHNYHVVTKIDGSEGLAYAQAKHPDVIILDVMMPNMDGWEILQRLRNHPETADIPIIICSVFADEELALSLEANQFLPKPVTQEQVLSVLRQMQIIW